MLRKNIWLMIVLLVMSGVMRGAHGGAGDKAGAAVSNGGVAMLPANDVGIMTFMSLTQSVDRNTILQQKIYDQNVAAGNWRTQVTNTILTSVAGWAAPTLAAMAFKIFWDRRTQKNYQNLDPVVKRNKHNEQTITFVERSNKQEKTMLAEVMRLRQEALKLPVDSVERKELLEIATLKMQACKNLNTHLVTTTTPAQQLALAAPAA